MTPAYRVFIAVDVIAALRSSRGTDKRAITRLFDELADNPFRAGDYVERDEAGRLVQILVLGRRAVCFWADHAMKEVKILELRPTGN